MKRTPPPRLAKAKRDAGARGKFYLTYPKKLVKEPLIYQMSRKFDLVFNVRSASVSEELGIIALELDGRQEGRGAGYAWDMGHVGRVEVDGMECSERGVLGDSTTGT